MAWVKQYKVVQDSPLGYQTVNEMGTNLALVRTELIAQHGTQEPGGGLVGVDFHALGKHDMIEVPRSVANVRNFAQANGSNSASLAWGGPAVDSFSRVATGVYYFRVAAAVAQWWATAAVIGSSADTFLPPIVRPFYASSSNGGLSGIWVATFGLDTGDFVPTDLDFTLTIYGDVP